MIRSAARIPPQDFLRISRTARALHGSAARIPPAPETPLVAAPDRSLQPEIVAALENTQEEREEDYK